MQDDRKVIWQAQEGSQQLFLTCTIEEALYHGTRGPGKSDALLMDFAQDVGKGFGIHWRGVVFRREYKELDDLVVKSKKWFRQIFPEANFLSSKSDYKWVWPTGEELLFRHFKKPDDYWNYHGHEYPWIGWDELTSWPSLEGYDAMKSCNRTSYKGEAPMHLRIRATTNPFGVGHNVVKKYFIDPAENGSIIKDDTGRRRVAIFGSIVENQYLDDDYMNTIKSVTDDNKRKAWLEGSWDITSGGLFDDLWKHNVHVIEPFVIPHSWYIDRGFDWGSSSPFAVVWFAESNGEQVQLADGTFRTFPPGTIFCIEEWYGADPNKENTGLNMLAGDIAEGIKARQEDMGWYDTDIEQFYPYKILPGPADTSIYDVINGQSIAHDMELEGVHWTKANKGAGSRVNGWEQIRNRLNNSVEHPLEKPGFYVFSNCRNIISLLPSSSRDSKNPDDLDTDSEDHIQDVIRYRVASKKSITRKTKARI